MLNAERLTEINRRLGWVFAGFAGFVLLLWLAGRDDPHHGGGYAFVVMLLVAPIGPLLWAAAAAHRHKWRVRWIVQLLPLLYVIAIGTGEAPVFLNAAVTLAASHRTKTSAAPAQQALVLTGDGIGPVRVGMTWGALHKDAQVLRDTTELGSEGDPENVAVVAMAGDTVRAVIDSDRVHRIDVTSVRLRTRSGLGVGTQLRELLRYPNVYALTGEGAVFVQLPSVCGTSFELADSGTLADGPDSVGMSALQHLPPSTRVSTVQLVGCAQAASVSMTQASSEQ